MTATDNGARATVDTPQGPIAYRELGEGEPVVFVHGLLVNSRLWDGVAADLAGSHRCIVADWPMGSHKLAMNEDADLSPPGLARIIVAFMDKLGIERATIVGNDTGGAISQILTANHPDRVERLVLTNCDTYEHFPPFPFNGLPVVARIPGAFRVLAAPFRLGPARRATYAPLASDKAVARDARKVTAAIHKRYTIAAAEQLRTFERPVLLAWAPEDRLFPIAHAHRLANELPDAVVEQVADSYTFVPEDQPARLVQLVAAFVGDRVQA